MTRRHPPHPARLSPTLIAAAFAAGCAAPPQPPITTPAPTALAALPSPEPAPLPASTWWRAPAAQTPACRAALDAVRADLRDSPTTTLLAVRGRDVVFDDGPIDRPSIIASARKSLLAMLYGKPVEQGTINLDATLADLGIDDLGGLLPIERQARVRDLLAARSGVYHPAANPGDSSDDAPPRGSQQPGTYFLYNNWDFNALGDIFEQRTGRNLYRAFDEDIARPLGLEDFHVEREHRSGDASRSFHLAYHFHLSARDMARVGELMLAHGRWNGRQLVPADWIATITTPVTPSAQMHPPRDARRKIGYGDLWWIPEQPADSPLAGAYFAWGYFGQFILVVPKRDMVVVHKFDTRAAIGDPVPHLGPNQFLALARRLVDAPCD